MPVRAFICCLFLGLAAAVNAGDRQVVGVVRAELVYASPQASELGQPVGETREELLGKQKGLQGQQFRLLGSDRQKLLRSYVNWLKPLGASKQIMIEFDTLGVSEDQVRLTLKLWQDEKVILKTDIALKKGKPLIIQGPAWRDGRVLVIVDLMSLNSGS